MADEFFRPDEEDEEDELGMGTRHHVNHRPVPHPGVFRSAMTCCPPALKPMEDGSYVDLRSYD